MSELKNTALGEPGEIGYSLLNPANNRTAAINQTSSMITATLILTALVIVISLDNDEVQHPE
jgi:hypothetical protein